MTFGVARHPPLDLGILVTVFCAPVDRSGRHFPQRPVGPIRGLAPYDGLRNGHLGLSANDPSPGMTSASGRPLSVTACSSET